MQISVKIKQRCLACKNKIKKGELIIIKKDGTIIHDDCLRILKKRKTIA